MTYSVKEVFYTLQGEGANAGRAAVFCRFAGCNLWSGREEDRASAQCRFCDTDFVGTDGTCGGKYASADDLADMVESHWPSADRARRFVVLTGGEPMLQIDPHLLAALHARGFTVAVETNGTLVPTPGIDWLCVSPKAGTPLAAVAGQELKLVFPQVGIDPVQYEQLAFENFYLQPMDGPDKAQNTLAAVSYCQAHPRWILSTQMHKIHGIR